MNSAAKKEQHINIVPLSKEESSIDEKYEILNIKADIILEKISEKKVKKVS